LGGWIEFCRRNPEGEVFHRKTFVAAYVKAAGDNEKPSLIYGNSSRKYERGFLLFGDKEACQNILVSAEKPLQAIEDMTNKLKLKEGYDD
jgi:hypothetical protein